MKSIKDIVREKKKFKYRRVQGIYFLFDVDSLIYIGCSFDCEGRILTHSKDKKFDSYSIIEINASKVGMLKLENRYIQKYKPLLNKTIKTPGVPNVKQELTEHEKDIARNIKKLRIKEQETVYVEPEIDDLEYWTNEELNQLRDLDGSRSDEYFYYKKIMKERRKVGFFKNSPEMNPDAC